ncbi:g9030 [Coccomyxa elongata]
MKMCSPASAEEDLGWKSLPRFVEIFPLEIYLAEKWAQVWVPPTVVQQEGPKPLLPQYAPLSMGQFGDPGPLPAQDAPPTLVQGPEPLLVQCAPPSMGQQEDPGPSTMAQQEGVEPLPSQHVPALQGQKAPGPVLPQHGPW